MSSTKMITPPLDRDGILNVASKIKRSQDIRALARAVLNKGTHDTTLSDELNKMHDDAVKREAIEFENIVHVYETEQRPDGIVGAFQTKRGRWNVIEPVTDDADFGISSTRYPPMSLRIDLAKKDAKYINRVVRVLIKNTDDTLEAIRKNMDSEDFKANADSYEREVWPRYLEEYSDVAEKLKAFAQENGIAFTGGSCKGQRQRYDKRTVCELKTLANSRGIPGYSKMNKEDLIARLRAARSARK